MSILASSGTGDAMSSCRINEGFVVPSEDPSQRQTPLHVKPTGESSCPAGVTRHHTEGEILRDPLGHMAAISLSHLSVEKREHRAAHSWRVMERQGAFVSTSLRRCSKCHVGSSLLCEAGEGRISLDVHCCQTTCGSTGRLWALSRADDCSKEKRGTKRVNLPHLGFV